jgi:hypothetical protein
MWRKLPQLRDPARFEAWTYRLLVNAAAARPDDPLSAAETATQHTTWSP